MVGSISINSSTNSVVASLMKIGRSISLICLSTKNSDTFLLLLKLSQGGPKPFLWPPHGDQGLSAQLSTPPPPSFHGYHGNSSMLRMVIRHFPFHPPPSSSPLVTMATPAGGQWVLSYPTDPYYPELLPTKPWPIMKPHNTLSSWLHPDYKNWAAISPAWLLWPCSLGMVNLAQERTLNKACLKPVCFVIWLRFGLPICVDLTLVLYRFLFALKR
jgi:hypothetical protein